MMRRLVPTAVLAGLVLAATASAATAPTVSVAVSPDSGSAPSALVIALSGQLPAGFPSALSFTVPRGFTSSARSVSALCSASAGRSGSCPAASDVGSGTVTAHVTLLGTLRVPLTVALGVPSHAGDIAAVDAYGRADGYLLAVSGRLLQPAGGGLELLFDSFPAPPSGLSLTIQSLALEVHAQRTITQHVIVRRHGHRRRITRRTTYSLITNPPTCHGGWAGSATAAYPSGTQTVPFTIPCRGI